MHFGFQLRMFLKFQPTRLADRGLSDIHLDLIPGTMAINLTIHGYLWALFPLSNTL